LEELLYYYEIARYTLNRGKPLLLLSQGFGPLNRHINRKALNKLLNNPLTFGVMRDLVSYKYFSSISKRVISGTDYGPYYLQKKGIIPEKRTTESGLAVIVLKNGTSVDDVLNSLRLNNLTECALWVFTIIMTKKREVSSNLRPDQMDSKLESLPKTSKA
jgi:hypothetical protein